MKLKNIESIEELKVGDHIYDIRGAHKIEAKCEGAVMASIEKYRGGMYWNEWLTLEKLIENFQIEDKSEGWVPKDGEVIWGVILDHEDVTFTANYCDTSEHHRLWLKRGIIFQTKEEAVACAKRMLEAIKK